MYEGYLLEINGEKIPERYIDISLYQTETKGNLLLEYEDGAYTTHRIYTPRQKKILIFSTQELPVKDYKRLSELLNIKSTTIKYYNPKINGYESGLFFAPREIAEEIYIRKTGEVYVKPVKIEMEGA